MDWKSLIAIQSVRNMLTIEEGKRYLGIMPAVAGETMGLKLVCFYPGNAGTSVPTHTAVILLFRPETGEPLVVMDDYRNAHRKWLFRVGRYRMRTRSDFVRDVI